MPPGRLHLTVSQPAGTVPACKPTTWRRVPGAWLHTRAGGRGCRAQAAWDPGSLSRVPLAGPHWQPAASCPPSRSPGRARWPSEGGPLSAAPSWEAVGEALRAGREPPPPGRPWRGAVQHGRAEVRLRLPEGGRGEQGSSHLPAAASGPGAVPTRVPRRGGWFCADEGGRWRRPGIDCASWWPQSFPPSLACAYGRPRPPQVLLICCGWGRGVSRRGGCEADGEGLDAGLSLRRRARLRLEAC